MDTLIKEMAKRKKAIGGFFLFLFLMFLCTLISKGIYAAGLTRVTTDTIEKTGIAHKVETEGMLVAEKSLAVTTIPGLTVEEIFVQKGDRVTQETPLFRVSRESLQDAVAQQELSIQKLQLATQSLLENAALAEIKDETARTRAAEDYAIHVDEAQEKINQAKKALDQAEDKLQEHRDNQVKVTSDERREDKKDDYQDWQAEGKELGRRVSDAKEALKRAEEALADGSGTQEQVDAAQDAYDEAVKSDNEYQTESRERPDFSEEDAAIAAWESEEETLKDAVKKATEAYETAVKEKNAALLAGQRALEDSHGNIPSDSTAQSNRLELAYQQSCLARYQELSAKEGIVCADREGIVTQVGITPGEKTPGGASLTYADLSGNLQFVTTLTKEEKKYVRLGDTVDISLDAGSSYECSVEYLMPSEQNPDSYELLCTMPEGAGTVGQSAALHTQWLSGQYSCCIPIDALHGENGQYYIYAVEERETILGKELAAVKQKVTVLDKNDKFAALENGTLDETSQMIVSSDHELADGDIVRYKE